MLLTLRDSTRAGTVKMRDGGAKRLGNISLAINLTAVITSLIVIAVGVVLISIRFHSRRYYPIDYECFYIQDGSGSILACP